MSNTNQVIQLTELTDENLLQICQAAQVIACECPAYLARLLRQVRVFREYTTNCMEQFPQDKKTHEWLAAKATEVEKILFDTMVELMRKENLIDDKLNVLIDKLSDRAREIVFQQLGVTD